jgi:hypothetical protein
MRGFITLGELEKIFYLFSNSIDYKSLHKVKWGFEKSFKSYLKNQWLWCWEQTWFGRVDTLHAIMSKSKHCWWRDSNYTEKLVTESLIQITYNFPDILGIIIGC